MPWQWMSARGDTVVVATQTGDSGGASTLSLKFASPTDTLVLTSNRQAGKAGMVDLGCVKLSGRPPIFSPGMAFDWNGRDIAVVRRTEYDPLEYRLRASCALSRR